MWGRSTWDRRGAWTGPPANVICRLERNDRSPKAGPARGRERDGHGTGRAGPDVSSSWSESASVTRRVQWN